MYLKKRETDLSKAQSWLIFLHNHHEVIAAMDFFTVPTATFSILFVFFVIHHGRRKLFHWNITDHPTAEWVLQQLREAFPYDKIPKYLIFDRDRIFSKQVMTMVRPFGIKAVRTSYRSQVLMSGRGVTLRPPPLRTVRAAFTAHGSCISRTYLVNQKLAFGQRHAR